MKRSIILLIIVAVVLPILAHEFWLQPEKFMYKPGEDINVRFWVGEDFDGSNWSGNRDKVKSLSLYLEDDIVDDIADQVSDEKGDSLQLSVLDEGTPMITFNSTNSFIELDAAKFNAYLQEDSLQEAADYRTAHQQTDSVGREFYQRSVKTLVQVGDQKTNISHSTNLPLDIIPLSNPYAAKENDSIGVKLLFKGQPMVQQMVNIWQRLDGKTTRQSYFTNEHGITRFAIIPEGKWMVSTVKMQHLENDATANWQSYWGSCTWGYQ
ncbi:MAG: DUF4198 domain-containing protein [Chitinophagaceae bacterium]